MQINGIQKKVVVLAICFSFSLNGMQEGGTGDYSPGSSGKDTNKPFIDFMSSELKLHELCAIDKAPLTPRTCESLEAKIADLKDRALGPRVGDPRGEEVADGFMQRIWTRDEALAERIRIAAAKAQGSDSTPIHPKIQEIPPAPEILSQDSNSLITSLEISGLVLLAWVTAETIIAYSEISQKEWDEAKGIHKLALLASKTGDRMMARPGQLFDKATTFVSG